MDTYSRASVTRLFLPLSKGSGFYLIKLAELFWSRYEMTNEINKAQFYEMETGAREAMQRLAGR